VGITGKSTLENGQTLTPAAGFLFTSFLQV